jgi:uncharacterized membrane protein YtjA (UPF0391 family)
MEMIAGTPHGMDDVVFVIFEFSGRLILFLIFIVVGSKLINAVSDSGDNENKK